MKTPLLSILFLFAFFGPLAASEPDPISVAIFDFQVSGEKFGDAGKEAALLLNAGLSSSPNVLLVERQELEKILGEQELGLSGTVDAPTAAKIGLLTGAKVLITGRLFESGDKIFLVAKVMSTGNGRVFGETVSFPSLKTLDQTVETLKGKLETLLEKRAAALVPETESPQARIARWKKTVEGKPLPKVSVAITEQHLSARVIDPAVETEFKLTLEQLGFPIVNAGESDLQISGEAFSEAGMRRGNLVTARARVEIGVHRKADGALIAVDRQTDAGLDLAENTAAKKALENAAVKLLDRLIPKLADTLKE